MFQIDNYKVVFQYEPESVVEVSLPLEPNKVVKRSGMYAHILESTDRSVSGKPEWQYLFSGFAIAHPDQSKRSSKNCGRKVALRRALKNAGFDTPTRTRFWEAYFSARGKVD